MSFICWNAIVRFRQLYSESEQRGQLLRKLPEVRLVRLLGVFYLGLAPWRAVVVFLANISPMTRADAERLFTSVRAVNT